MIKSIKELKNNIDKFPLEYDFAIIFECLFNLKSYMLKDPNSSRENVKAMEEHVIFSLSNIMDNLFETLNMEKIKEMTIFLDLFFKGEIKNEK